MNAVKGDNLVLPDLQAACAPESGEACDLEALIAYYSQAILRDPTDAVAYHRRGFAYNRKGEFQNAIADCQEAIRLDPNNGVAYRILGSTHCLIGDYDEAIACCTAAIELDPSDAQAFGLLR